MPGQIPQALGVLNEFLAAENVRLEQEIKQDDIQRTIEQVAGKFGELGPDASQDDVRKLYYKALEFGAETPETIPFITQMFSESAQFVRNEKLSRQEENLISAMEEVTGEDYGDVGGAGAQFLSTFGVKEMPLVIDEGGKRKGYYREFKQSGGFWEQKGDDILVQETDLPKTGGGYGGYGGNKYQQGNYQVRNTITDEVSPASWDATNNRYVPTDIRTGLPREFMPGEELEIRSTATSESTNLNRSEKSTLRTYDYRLAELQDDVPDFALDLDASGYDIDKNEYRNSMSFKPQEHAYNKLMGERQQIADHIAAMDGSINKSDPDYNPKKASLNKKFINFNEKANAFLKIQKETMKGSKQGDGTFSTGGDWKNPEEATMLLIQKIFDSGPKGEYASYWQIINGQTMQRMNMPLARVKELAEQNKLSIQQLTQWHQILVEIENL